MAGKNGHRGKQAKHHFTIESKARLLAGAMKGGSAEKHFTPDSKNRQIMGARRGGQHSHDKR